MNEPVEGPLLAFTIEALDIVQKDGRP